VVSSFNLIEVVVQEVPVGNEEIVVPTANGNA
jgi:hypothetical protein